MAGLSSWFNYFSGIADKLEGATVPPANPNYFAYTAKEPVGVVGCITPWNSPVLLFTWKPAPGIDKIAFTGSTATGIAVGMAALSNVNRASLELGGKSCQLVFPDADLDAAAKGVVAGVLAATGQTCMAGSRVVAPNMPFGGFGISGIGRENGIAAVEEYLETKSVYVELAGELRDPFKLG